MKYFLGIDAGGSKTEALILDERGNIVGFGRSGPGNYESVGIEKAKENWLLAIEQAKSGVEIENFEAACFGLAGADFPEDFEMLGQVVASLGITQNYSVENDTAIALKAGNPEFWGVLIVMGAGTNGYGRTRDGRNFRYYGEGYAFGDWGGGSWVVQEMLHMAFRSYDGRGEKTLLEDEVLSYFQYDNYDEFAKALYYNRIPRDKIIHMAPLLFELASKGDRVALNIAFRVCDEVVTMARAVIKRLELLDHEVPVVLAGSLFKGAPWMIEYISAKLHAYVPKAGVKLLTAKPVVGAALLAWESAGRDWKSLWPALERFD
ncbi:MAG: kinase [Clostridiales bacterium]|nr:kinase [Clostridiales bacterium]